MGGVCRDAAKCASACAWVNKQTAGFWGGHSPSIHKCMGQYKMKGEGRMRGYSPSVLKCRGRYKMYGRKRGVQPLVQKCMGGTAQGRRLKLFHCAGETRYTYTHTHTRTHRQRRRGMDIGKV